MGTTDVQQLPYPDSNSAPNLPQIVGNLARETELRLVMGFASAADRTSRLSGTGLFDGMVSYLTDIKVFQEYRGGAWVAFNGTMHDEWTGTFTLPLATITDIGTSPSRATSRAVGNVTGRINQPSTGLLRISNPTPTAELWSVSLIAVCSAAVQVNSFIQIIDGSAEVIAHNDLTEGETTLITTGEIVVPANGGANVQCQVFQRAGTGQTGTNSVTYRVKFTRR